MSLTQFKIKNMKKKNLLMTAIAILGQNSD
jgi:hypothetical protein